MARESRRSARNAATNKAPASPEAAAGEAAEPSKVDAEDIKTTAATAEKGDLEVRNKSGENSKDLGEDGDNEDSKAKKSEDVELKESKPDSPETKKISETSESSDTKVATNADESAPKDQSEKPGDNADGMEVDETSGQEKISKDQNPKETEVKDQESEDQETKDQESKDQESKDQESKDQESKNQESKDQEGKDHESKAQDEEGKMNESSKENTAATAQAEDVASSQQASRKRRFMSPEHAFESIFGIAKKHRRDAEITASMVAEAQDPAAESEQSTLTLQEAQKALDDLTDTALEKAPKVRRFSQQVVNRLNRPRKGRAEDEIEVAEVVDSRALVDANLAKQKLAESKAKFRAKIIGLENQVRMLKAAERKRVIREGSSSGSNVGAKYGQFRAPSVANAEFKTLEENTHSPEAQDLLDRIVNAPSTCNCTSEEQDCSRESSCKNREGQKECPEACPVAECKNQQLRKKVWAKTRVAKSKRPPLGIGLLADEAIKDGDLIVEYTGEVITASQAKQRLNRRYSRLFHEYIFHLSSRLRIDATERGSVARFINHSCNPNAVAEVWNVDGKLRVGIWAKRDILEGEEITFEYSYPEAGEARIRCACAEPGCRKYVGASSLEHKTIPRRTSAMDPITGVKLDAALSLPRLQTQVALIKSLLEAQQHAQKGKAAIDWLPVHDVELLRQSRVFQARAVEKVLKTDFAALLS